MAGIEKPGNHPYQYNAQSLKDGHPFLDRYHYQTTYRHYSPALGRFMALDPQAASMPSINPYHFGFNNPIAFNDPNGDVPIASVFIDLGLRILFKGLEDIGVKVPGWAQTAVHIGAQIGFGYYQFQRDKKLQGYLIDKRAKELF
ncbi:MAG: hypothetical protein HC913_05480 [Microscillaceae bacterium]|nr:hypothetical protein [Microscillaceae bacterium]